MADVHLCVVYRTSGMGRQTPGAMVFAHSPVALCSSTAPVDESSRLPALELSVEGRALGRATRGIDAVEPRGEAVDRCRHARRRRAEAILPGSIGSIALVARKTPGGSAREAESGNHAFRGADSRATFRARRLPALS